MSRMSLILAGAVVALAAMTGAVPSADARQGGHGGHVAVGGGFSGGGLRAAPGGHMGGASAFRAGPSVGHRLKAYGGGVPKAFYGGRIGRGHIGPPPGFKTPKPPSVAHKPGGWKPAHKHHHHKHVRIRPYPYDYTYEPYYYYEPSYAYADECAWLYRKAVRTGSRYWWRRYYECVEEY